MSSKLFRILVLGFRGRFFVKRNWLRQMTNATGVTERNQNSPVLNSVHHLPKSWSDRSTSVNCRKALYPKACDTASSHRYLPLGTFRQRAVRDGCIRADKGLAEKQARLRKMCDAVDWDQIMDHRSKRRGISRESQEKELWVWRVSLIVFLTIVI